MFSVEHIGLAATDPRGLRSWYQEVLNAELLVTISEDPPAFLLRLGGLIVELYSAEASTELTQNNRLGGWRHLALKVESLERARAELEQRGVVFYEPVRPAGGGGRVQFFADPEGNLFHLVERPAGALQV